MGSANSNREILVVILKSDSNMWSVPRIIMPTARPFIRNIVASLSMTLLSRLFNIPSPITQTAFETPTTMPALKSSDLFLIVLTEYMPITLPAMNISVESNLSPTTNPARTLNTTAIIMAGLTPNRSPISIGTIATGTKYAGPLESEIALPIAAITTIIKATSKRRLLLEYIAGS